MRYLDSNVFVYAALSSESERQSTLSRSILERVFGGQLHAATSALTWDEVTWVIRKLEGEATAASEGKKFLSFPRLVLLDVSEGTVGIAQDVMGRYKLTPRDAIHAACCIENGIDEIVTDDQDFDGVKEIKRVPLSKA